MSEQKTLSYLERKLLRSKQGALSAALRKAHQDGIDAMNNALGIDREENGVRIGLDNKEIAEVNAWLASHLCVSQVYHKGAWGVVTGNPAPMPECLERSLLRVATEELLERIKSVEELSGSAMQAAENAGNQG